jgi:hypothetical protein
VSDPRSERKTDTPTRRTKPRARKKRTSIWHLGALFHVTTRYPRKAHVARIDRLAGILRNGLVAPASCQDGSVRSDLNIVVTGADVPYDSLIFLHRFGEMSYIYTLDAPGRFAVFVNPDIPVLTQEAMGENWAILCQDEVYVKERIPLEHITHIAVHDGDAELVLGELLADFQRLGIPLYDYRGNVLWQPAARWRR